MKSKHIHLGLIALTAFCYASVSHHDFINLDDPPFVYGNPHLTHGLTREAIIWAFKAGLFFSTPNIDYWQPLTILSRLVEVTLFGMDPHSQHVVNLILHIINTCLLFRVLETMTGSQWRSATVALLFGIHPLHVESVAWVTERKDVLGAFFFILCLWSYHRYRLSPSVRRYTLLFALFACSLMSKPIGLTLPFVLLLLDVWPLKPFGTEKSALLLIQKTPLLALTGASIWITLKEQGQHLGNATGAHPIAAALMGYQNYLQKTFLPIGLSIWHTPLTTTPVFQLVLASLLLLAISIWVCFKLRTHPHLFVGWFWFLGMLVPSISLKDVAWAERFTYLPLLGIFIMIAWSLPDPKRLRAAGQQIFYGSTLFVITSLSVLTYRQVGCWKDSITLYKHALSVEPGAPLVQYNLGLAYFQAGRHSDARTHFEEALRLNPDLGEAWDSLGALALMEGRVEEAVRCGEKAIALKPKLAAAQEHFASALVQKGDETGAMIHYRQALGLNPGSVSVLCNLGVLVARRGDPNEALQLYQRGLQIQPRDPEILNNLGNLYFRCGMQTEARGCYQRAIEARPGYAEALFSLGSIHALNHENDQAIEFFHRALVARPGDILIQYNLGATLAEAGRMDEARGFLLPIAQQNIQPNLAQQASQILRKGK